MRIGPRKPKIALFFRLTTTEAHAFPNGHALPIIAMGLAEQGTAILSGILREERETMLAVLAAHGWRVLAEDAEEIWWSVSIARA